MPYDCHLFGPETAEAAPVEAPTVRSAILLAADHIEQHPELFVFRVCRVPECGSRGCALGWIAFFRHATAGSAITTGAGLNIGDWEFYLRMRELGDGWKQDTAKCAHTLRLYADTYHKEPVHAV